MTTTHTRKTTNTTKTTKENDNMSIYEKHRKNYERSLARHEATKKDAEAKLKNAQAAIDEATEKLEQADVSTFAGYGEAKTLQGFIAAQSVRVDQFKQVLDNLSESEPFWSPLVPLVEDLISTAAGVAVSVDDMGPSSVLGAEQIKGGLEVGRVCGNVRVNMSNPVVSLDVAKMKRLMEDRGWHVRVNPGTADMLELAIFSASEEVPTIPDAFDPAKFHVAVCDLVENVCLTTLLRMNGFDSHAVRVDESISDGVFTTTYDLSGLPAVSNDGGKMDTPHGLVSIGETPLSSYLSRLNGTLIAGYGRVVDVSGMKMTLVRR